VTEAQRKYVAQTVECPVFAAAVVEAAGALASLDTLRLA